MPELPEVETTARELDKKISGKKIIDVWTDYHSTYKHYKDQIKNPKYFTYFAGEVQGEKIKEVRRRGKNILIKLSGEKTIIIHMKMTGHLLYGQYVHIKDVKNYELKIKDRKFLEKWEGEEWIPDEGPDSPLWDPFNRHIHLVFALSDGKHLVFSDARKFGKVQVVSNDELAKESGIGGLGPNPLDLSAEEFLERLDTRQSGKIKQVLMDQKVLAGVGNIYSDEALWKAGVHPASSLNKIPEDKLKDLFKNLKEVLKKGLKLSGDSTSDYRKPDGRRGKFHHTHNVYMKAGEACTRDDAKIEKTKVGGRTAHFCPKHQKKY